MSKKRFYVKERFARKRTKTKNSPCLLRLLPPRGREPVFALDPVFEDADDQPRLIGLGAAVAEEP